MITGIYRILNTITKDFYIGSATNFTIRKSCHFHNLRNNKHANKHLQNAWDKYKEHNFKFEILVKCPKEYLIKLEQWFINTQNPKYNICKIAGNTFGRKFSDETKKKMSKKKKDFKPSAYCIKRSIETHKGVKQSPEFIEKRRKSIIKNIGNRKCDILNKEKVNEIIDQFNNGTLPKIIANNNNISIELTNLILNGKIWKDCSKNINQNIRKYYISNFYKFRNTTDNFLKHGL